MNWVDTLNHLIDYIEAHLEEEINPRQVELITGCQYSIFQRMFSYISGVSITEYIRRRKISEGAYELQTLKVRVIDVALKYGYESADAFCVAFKKQHGVTPTEAKKQNIKLSAYPRLTFSLNITGGSAMDYRVVDKEQVKVVGIFGDINEGIWDQVKKDGTLAKLNSYGENHISLGLCFGYDDNGKNTYMVAVKEPENIEINFKYDTYTIPASSWLVFESVGPVFPTLQNIWKRIYGEFIPSNNYIQNPRIPTVEKYYGNETEAKNYTVEIWIPITNSK
jgi:AraC family transcriptional regulator